MTSISNIAPAFDPALHPELYEGVLVRRTLAFFVDLAVIAILTMAGFLIVFILGLFTIGIGWLLYSLVCPLVIFGYAAFTLGLYSRTIGMGLLGLEMRQQHGASMTMLMAVGHMVLFYIVTVLLTPLTLAIALFNRKKRFIHDMLLGVVLINDPVKASTYVKR